MKKDIYELILHEGAIAEDNQSLFTTVLRVPGGWMYRSFDKSHNILASVFVPFDNEFQSAINVTKKEDHL